MNEWTVVLVQASVVVIFNGNDGKGHSVSHVAGATAQAPPSTRSWPLTTASVETVGTDELRRFELRRPFESSVMGWMIQNGPVYT
ncbi:hypothetical protein PC116_g16073 [Phytophthora cactorum]|nr:hypothetical protein PC116_g16073 [Phytophthora cactorum]